MTAREPETGHRDGPKSPSTKSTQQFSERPLRRVLNTRKGYRTWTRDMVLKMQAHPDMTAAEIASMLHTTASAVRHARQRYGRFRDPKDALCAVCEKRPVWMESRQAASMSLCKACFIDEMNRRIDEDRPAARMRQRKSRKGKA